MSNVNPDYRFPVALESHDRRGRLMKSRLAEIERMLRHAEGTRSTETDSWLNAYQEDVRWLVTRLRERI